MALVQKKKNPLSGQFLYLGRWVSKDNFRTFVYGKDDQKLANSYDEYRKLIESGIWFDEKESAVDKPKVKSKAEIKAQLKEAATNRTPENGTDS